MTPLYGLFPGVIKSYLGDPRFVTVSIEGLTDGSTVYPEAVLSVPVGDRPELTEQLIVGGDLCWIQFQRGDPRYPVVTGYRTPEATNQVGWRRWQHANIETIATAISQHEAATYAITATESITFTVGGKSFVLTAAGFTLIGPVEQSGGDIVSDGISVQTHPHVGVKKGDDVSGPPE